LSDRRIRALKSAHCDKWYSDGNGLYLRVRATGGRSWVLRRKILKTALRFAVDAGYLEISPVDRLSSELVGGAETSRDRVLSDKELRRLWQARSTHTPLLRFLLLTGHGIGEAQRATWSHVLGGRWHIPKEHSKNHRAHWVALSRQALALLRGQDQCRELIFGTATDTGVQAWLRRWCERERISPAFRPHDLRRTCAPDFRGAYRGCLPRDPCTARP
jgi:integrase